ncbi:hypothetical protein PR048_022103 [Dryococelus australis]|uniref:Uncharacterized protein n=1 Tax=Dryococelus australis TaxID=614101 RepID=A0ABQ9H039_9NEOP|nr:hypothetical protein PR048_022103 [Dryococelus australis]
MVESSVQYHRRKGWAHRTGLQIPLSMLLETVDAQIIRAASAGTWQCLCLKFGEREVFQMPDVYPMVPDILNGNMAKHLRVDHTTFQRLLLDVASIKNGAGVLNFSFYSDWHWNILPYRLIGFQHTKKCRMRSNTEDLEY